MLPIPDQADWQEIEYRPRPLVTRLRYGGDKYWLDQGCTIEVIEEKLGIMTYLTNDIKVRITWPPDHREVYVEPLATLHKAFWDAMDAVIHDVYPYPINRRSWQQKRQWELGRKVHSMVAGAYWEADWRAHTPPSWADTLNKILDVVRSRRIKEEEGLSALNDEVCWVFRGEND